jgi:hypothetical protein
MPSVPTPARFKRAEASRRVTNGIPLGCPLFLPVDTVNCVQTLKVIWIGGASLFWIFEQETIANIPQALFYTAVFLGGEWALCDFGYAGKVLCVLFCVIGIALFGTFVGFLADSFGEVLEERGERRAAAKSAAAAAAVVVSARADTGAGAESIGGKTDK